MIAQGLVSTIINNQVWFSRKITLSSLAFPEPRNVHCNVVVESYGTIKIINPIKKVCKRINDIETTLGNATFVMTMSIYQKLEHLNV